jgi:DNA-binding GntR family transcriptional regulator
MATSAETIRIELANRIVSRNLAPGAELDESVLAAEFNVSRTPVREALRALRTLGLVVQRPHAKAVVRKPDDAELAGMFFVLGQLETLCAGLCAGSMTKAERDSLEKLHARMAASVRDGDAGSYAKGNEAFHSAIQAGTRNAYLAEMAGMTRLRVQPFSRAQFTDMGRLAASHAEHDAIVTAILRGDAQAASRAMASHIGHVEEVWNRVARRIETGSAVSP